MTGCGLGFFPWEVASTPGEIESCATVELRSCSCDSVGSRAVGSVATGLGSSCAGKFASYGVSVDVSYRNGADLQQDILCRRVSGRTQKAEEEEEEAMEAAGLTRGFHLIGCDERGAKSNLRA